VRRREFIALVGGAAIVTPVTVRSQQTAKSVIGFLSTGSPDTLPASILAAFREGLAEVGYIEGRNVTIEYRFAEGRYERLPQLAAELVNLSVAVIVTSGSSSATAAKTATSTVPIVIVFAGDPVASHLVTTLNRPSGNITGVSFMIAQLGAKKLELLRELVPEARTFALLVNPANPPAESERSDVEIAARALGKQIEVLTASSDADLENLSATLAQRPPSALIVGTDPFFLSRRERLVSIAAHLRLATIYSLREFVLAGGLISYGTRLSDAYRQGGTYAGRILQGAKANELPIVQPTGFELVINLKTAKALEIQVPLRLQVWADEVIE
jgi:putative ABC transport system substrate-binding protein